VKVLPYPVIFLTAAALSVLLAQNADAPREIPLPTSKLISGASPGVFARLNGFAANLALSPDRRYAAILNDGYGAQKNQGHQSIAILELSTNQLTDFPETRLGEDAHQSYFIGLVFSTDGNHLYASMGSITDATGERPGDTGNGIAVYGFHQGKVAGEGFIKIPPQKIGAGKKVAYGLRKAGTDAAIPYPAGFAVIAGKDGDRLLIANNYSDNAVLVDAGSGRILQTFELSTHHMIPSEFPYTCVASRDGHRGWCSLWNASRVAELDLEKGTVVRVIPLGDPADPLQPGSHPTALLLSPDEKLLYVALANADLVGVISTATGKLAGTLSCRSAEKGHPRGIYPVALAQSGDGRRLFVAYSAINAVGVFEAPTLSTSSGLQTHGDLGLIPTEWYPSALAVAGDDLLIATSKGQGTGPNNFSGHTGYERRYRENAYIPTLLYGSIARLSLLEIDKRLTSFTREVEHNNRFQDDPGQVKFAKGSNPIRHVIYIIKENRTYDQILGDLKVGGRKIGNGDPSLTLYGAEITPNEHKLALQFGVLDNFYDSGEVSGDGHEWSMAAITTDYNEQTWQIGYRSKERAYDYQGTVADEIPLENNEPDVDDPMTGYIWDNVASHGLTYRDYGEYLAVVWCKPTGSKGSTYEGNSSPNPACARDAVRKDEALPPNVGQPHGSPSPWPWTVPLLKQTKPTKAVLRDHFDPLYPEFETDYPDQLRADEFLNEFDGFVSARNSGKGELPAFVLLYLPDDHTGGTRAGRPRPAASVADNDLAVGRVVDAVSHSAYWEDTAIFIVEDDAQDGADHVDAHRSIAFAISKYSPGSAGQPFVDSRFYTTVNMIHTIEALLGLPPMNQNDAYAPVMGPSFSGEGNQPAFAADWSNRDNGLIYQTNPAHARGTDASDKMDFTRPDANNAQLLNGILWRDRKGNAPMPAAKHTVLPQD
jgi:DNA-binding beta-propeller fold protein YncE